MRQAWRKPGLGELGRALGIALLIALALELLYVAGATVILRAHLLERWINRDPDELLVTFDSAWSVVPGKVRVHGLRVRVQDSNVQFLLHIDEATADIALFELAKKSFHVTQVKARGTRFSFRTRLELETIAGQEKRLKAYPPIAGFADPPLKGWNVPHRTLGTRPFRIEIEQVDASFDELWMMEYRYTGPGRVRGGFRLLPGERVRVGPALLELENGALKFGREQLVLERFRGTLRSRVDDFDVRAVRGWHVFDHVSVTGSLIASVRELGFVRAYLRDESFSVGAGSGTLDARIVMKRGRFEPDSRASYRSAQVEFSKAPFHLTGDIEVALKVERQNARPLGTLRVSATKIRAATQPRFGDFEPAELTGMNMSVSTHELGVSEPWKMAAGDFRVQELAVPDIRLLGVLGSDSKKVRIQSGSAAASARAKLERGSLLGQLTGRVDDARLRMNGTTLAVTAKASANLEQPSVVRGNGQLSEISVNASHVRAVTADGDTGPGSIALAGGTIDYAELAPSRLRATLTARFPDAKPVLAALGIHLSTLPKLAAQLVDTSNLRGVADLSHDRTRRAPVTDVRLREARTDGLVTSGRWRKTGASTRAAFLLDFDVARLGISVENSESSLAPFAAKGWLGEELARLGIGSGH
ncbi:MAG TPA: hypothetical protein VI072_27480 [Polyangiaceae bacterium]